VSGSVKGRTLLHASAREKYQQVATREGVCAWCGLTVFGLATGITRCPRCVSTEIDWKPPPTPPKGHYTRDEGYAPGSIAYSVLGGTVFRRR
jgi:hypothetical protein